MHDDQSFEAPASLEDTAPRPAVAVPPQVEQPPLWMPGDDDHAAGGPGCAMWGCISVIAIGLAFAVVLMAAAAGWTSGQREAANHATATQNASINEQLGRVPSDLSNGNLQLADTRLRYLATVAPDVAGLPELAATATSAYLTRQPTATPAATATPEATETPAEADDIVITPADEGGGYDLAAMLNDAQQAVNTGQYADAYDLLDVILAVDANFERTRVRELLTIALNGQARAMFNTDNPAQGIIWATRAENLGVLQGDMSFEMFAALKWRDAQAALGLNYAQAVNALREIINLGPGRYYDQAQAQLYDQYVRWGDALVNDPNQGYCPAIQQYRNALNVQGGGTASGKLNQAESMCAQATPTPGPEETPGTPETPGAPPADGQIAPVGEPG